MAANPALVSSPDGLAPAPFQGETIALARHGVDIAINGLRTANGKWSASGTLWLTDVRLVFVAPAANADGLQAFDFPLAYITHDKFNQPIFACNNLAGKVWPATGGGGPAGTLPPHEYKLYFKEGGVGTLLPLYYRLVSQARLTLQRTGTPAQTSAVPSAPQAPQSLAATALVDPSDPSKIFLTQPVSDEDRLPSAPVYASNYGQDEAYEPMEPAAAGQQQQQRQPSAQAPLI